MRAILRYLGMDIAVITVNFKAGKKYRNKTMDEKISLEAIAGRLKLLPGNTSLLPK